jgi:hypothetical protein
MTLTKDQLKSRFLPSLLVKRRQTVVWGDVVSAVAAATPQQKAAIVEKLKTKEYAQVGRDLAEILMASLTAEINQTLDSKLADNRLTIDELSDILE